MHRSVGFHPLEHRAGDGKHCLHVFLGAAEDPRLAVLAVANRGSSAFAEEDTEVKVS